MITLEIDQRLFSINQPLGAAAFTYDLSQDKKRLSIVFAMMKPNEDGLTALKRVRTQASQYEWVQVAIRPELQRMTGATDAEYVAYDFEYKNGAWQATTPVMDLFFEQMSRLAAVPAQPPKESHTSLATWTKKTGRSTTKKSA